MNDNVMNRILAAERDAADRFAKAKADADEAELHCEAECALKLADAEALEGKALKAAASKANEKAAEIIDSHRENAFTEAERMIREASVNLESAIATVAGEIINYGNK